jgi:hypothetical protein
MIWAMAGYSCTPLWRKLGIRPGDTVTLLDAPTGFAIADLPEGVEIRRAARGQAAVIVAFHTTRSTLAHRFTTLLRALEVDGGLWVAWPKRSSGVPSDITEDVVREIALPTGMVDNKVCAIDETWSGLRLVIRLENR